MEVAFDLSAPFCAPDLDLVLVDASTSIFEATLMDSEEELASDGESEEEEDEAELELDFAALDLLFSMYCTMICFIGRTSDEFYR